MMKKTRSRRHFLQRVLQSASLMLLALFYGVYAQQNHHLVAVVINDALESQLTLFKKPWYVIDARDKHTIQQRDPEKMQPGLTKLVHFTGDRELAVSVLKNDGTVVHRWQTDWFSLWPDADHLSYFMQPKTRPGTMVHGAEILPDGDLVFNFEYLGMIRLDPCGKVLWRLPYQSHHSVFIDDQGFIWTGVNKVRRNDSLQQGLHEPYYVEPFIFRIAADGTVAAEKSVFEILAENDLYGALHQSSIDNDDPVVRGDTLHLNDVEVFPATLPAGFFQPGDIMISLRNINTILVLQAGTWKVKHIASHMMLRQHDPDFIDGNTIRIYDNNNRFRKGAADAFSRIIDLHVPDNTVTVLFQGSPELPFFSKILGKQQTLDNGNLLLTESRGGRIIELAPQGRLVWEFNNLIDDNLAAIIQEAERLPVAMDEEFFTRNTADCRTTSQ